MKNLILILLAVLGFGCQAATPVPALYRSVFGDQFTATPNLGVGGGSNITLRAGSIATNLGMNVAMTWPSAHGTAGQVLSDNGSGVLSWVSPAGVGSVTSVAATAPVSLFTVSGSPITTSGTLAFTLTQTTSNLFWAGPINGGAQANPTFRGLSVSDFNGGLNASASSVLQGDFTWASYSSFLTLNNIGADNGSASINNGNFTNAWNWALTAANRRGLRLYESAASTGGDAYGNQVILEVGTKASSTAVPILVKVGDAIAMRGYGNYGTPQMLFGPDAGEAGNGKAAISFGLDPTSGFDIAAGPIIKAYIASAEAARFDQYGTKTIAGSLTHPSHSFISATSSGLLAEDASSFALIGGGVKSAHVNATTLALNNHQTAFSDRPGIIADLSFYGPIAYSDVGLSFTTVSPNTYFHLQNTTNNWLDIGNGDGGFDFWIAQTNVLGLRKHTITGAGYLPQVFVNSPIANRAAPALVFGLDTDTSTGTPGLNFPGFYYDQVNTLYTALGGSNYFGVRGASLVIRGVELAWPSTNSVGQQALVNNGSGVLSYLDVAGSGTVTSVGATAPTSLFTVSGSPITTAGTLAFALTQTTSNKFWAGPINGGAAANPTFRTISASDLNEGQNASADTVLHGNITWSAVTLNSAQVTGTLPSTKGGTDQSAWSAGALVYSDVDDHLSGLTIGNNGQFLVVSNNLPSWKDFPGGTSDNWLASGTTNSILAGIAFPYSIQTGDGSLTAPSHSFTNGAGSGMSFTTSGGNQVRLSVDLNDFINVKTNIISAVVGGTTTISSTPTIVSLVTTHPTTDLTYSLGSGANRWLGIRGGGLALSGVTYTLASQTPPLDISGTWNGAGETMTALKLNMTDTASAAASLLVDLQVGGATQLKLSKAGTLTTANSILPLTDLVGTLGGGANRWAGIRGGDLTLSGLTYTASGNILFDTSATWNDSGQTFNAWKLNITSTASAAGSLLINAQVGGSTLFSVAKDGNLAEIRDVPYTWPAAAAAGLLHSDGANPSILSFSTVATSDIANDAVTYAKIQNVSAASKLLGRGSASGAGDVEEITLGSGLTMTGTTLSAAGGGGASLDAVTADVASSTINNAAFTNTWQWALTGATQRGFTITESTAATNGETNQFLLDIRTITGSTATTLNISHADDATAILPHISLNQGKGSIYYGQSGIGVGALAINLALNGVTQFWVDSDYSHIEQPAITGIKYTFPSSATAGLLHTDGANPNVVTFSAVALGGSDVSGTLGTANGGTGTGTAGTQYGLPYYTTTTAMASTGAGTTTTLLHGNASGAPSFGAVATGDISNDAVTYAKIQNISAASKLLGRGSASGSGDAEEITIGSGLTMTGTTLSSSGGSPTLDTVLADAASAIIQNGVFTNVWLWTDPGANMSSFTIRGTNSTASSTLTLSGQMTSATAKFLNVTETTASTSGSGSQYLANFATIASSTATPLRVATRGTEIFRASHTLTQLLFADGSLSSPAVSFANDVNSGLVGNAGSGMIISGLGSKQFVAAGSTTGVSIGDDLASTKPQAVWNATTETHKDVSGNSNLIISDGLVTMLKTRLGNTGIGVAPDATRPLSIEMDALGTTVNAGMVMSNVTAAAAGAQQVSPAIYQQGKGWKTDATAASQPVEFRSYVLPVQGAANPSGTWTLESQVNNAGFQSPLTFTSGGVLAINSNPVVTNGVQTLGITLDGQGVAITTGVKGYLSVPYACTINSATMLGDQTGSAVVDVWRCTYSQFDAGATHPVSGDKITASAPPTITSTYKSQDTTLTGWTTTLAANDVLAFSVTSASAITRLTVVLKVTKQ